MASSVATRGSQLITTVRDGTSSLVDSAMNFLGVRYKLGGNSVETVTLSVVLEPMTERPSGLVEQLSVVTAPPLSSVQRTLARLQSVSDI